MGALQNSVVRSASWLKMLGSAALVGMMLVTVVDVIFRYFGHPIFGMVEIVSFLAIITLGCAMPVTHLDKGHVGVDLLTRKMPSPALRLLDTVTGTLTTALFGLVAYQMVIYGNQMRASGEVSMSLEFPIYILIYLLSLGFVVLTAVTLIGVVQLWGGGEDS